MMPPLAAVGADHDDTFTPAAGDGLIRSILVRGRARRAPA